MLLPDGWSECQICGGSSGPTGSSRWTGAGTNRVLAWLHEMDALRHDIGSLTRCGQVALEGSVDGLVVWRLFGALLPEITDIEAGISIPHQHFQ